MERISGCLVRWKCFVACLFFDESQQPTCPHSMHSRKCTQESCIFRHSSHPLVFGLTFLISSTCVQTSAMGPPPRLACGLNGNSYFKARVARHRFHRNDATHL